MPRQIEIRSHKTLNRRPVPLVISKGYPVDNGFNVRNRHSSASSDVGLKSAEEVFATPPRQPAINRVQCEKVQTMRGVERLDRVAYAF